MASPYTSPQDGTTLDTRLMSETPSTNVSTATSFGVGEPNTSASGYYSRGVLQFPGLTNGDVPSSATIISCSLFIKSLLDRSSNNRVFRIYRSKKDVVISQCTWQIYKTGNSWTANGGFHADDCEQTDIGNHELAASGEENVWQEFVLSPEAIQEIVNGTWSTPTLIVKADSELNDFWSFHSSEAVSSEDRPYIVVHYSEEAGSNIKKINGIARAAIKKMNGVALASIKKIGGIA